MGLSKTHIEDLLANMTMICIEQNGGSLESVFDRFKRPKLTPQEKAYLADLINWDND